MTFPFVHSCHKSMIVYITETGLPISLTERVLTS